MPRLRIVLMMVPRLLADMIRNVLARADGPPWVEECASLDTSPEYLASLAADAIILGPAATGIDAAIIRSALPHVRVLSLSPDLRWLNGPGEHERRPLNARNLVAALQA
jgi:hypothetical protein